MPVSLYRRMMATVLLAIGLWAAGPPLHAQPPVTVFAAASLKTALDEIAQGYDGEIRLSYGGSSTLARQIQQGAPAHVYLSANPGWMDMLEQDGLIEPGTRIDLLNNRLVLIAGPDTGPVPAMEPGFALADALGQDRLAMALVDAVPAGLYGRAALQSLGVWDDVRTKVAQADNVRAALMLVAMAEAPLGIVYATDAAADPRVHIAGTFPENSHPPIVYPAAAIKGPNQNAARIFLKYLQGDEARAIFQRNGFGLAGDGT
ncbi:molybdate ABC transporter substrate-binding protein [Rhodobacteraceae bacterium F11138]|nr:molybdate ABC transporter substrate-binding protein [Rhodobacteraceae bacterium F11138]